MSVGDRPTAPLPDERAEFKRSEVRRAYGDTAPLPDEELAAIEARHQSFALGADGRRWCSDDGDLDPCDASRLLAALRAERAARARVAARGLLVTQRPDDIPPDAWAGTTPAPDRREVTFCCGNCPHDPDAHSPVNEEFCSYRDCVCPGLLTVKTATPPPALDVERLARALHAAGIRCSPNIPSCRASHRNHAASLAAEYAALAAQEERP